MTDRNPEEIRRRIREWLKAQREYEETYEEGPIGDVLAKDADGNYIIPPEQVFGVFFDDSPTSADAIQAYLRANGDPRDLEEYGASLFRRAGGVTAEGLADLTVMNEWEARYRSALSMLPGLQNKLDEARSAQVALEAERARHQAEREAFLRSPAGLFIDNDPITATEKLFALPDTTAALRTLVDMMKGDQKTFDSLQSAVVNYILEKVGVTSDRAIEYLAFLTKHEQALAVLFNASKMQTFYNVAAALRQCALTPSMEPEGREGRLPTSAPKRGWRRLFGR